MVESVTLQCGTAEVTLLSTGASIREVNVPDSSGQVDDVVLGHPDLRDYQTDAHGAYFGCIVGRVANRIEGACFSDPSDSKTAPNVFHLEANDGANHLHGGSQHWGRQEWRIEQRPSPENPTAVFCRRSAEWEAGYPSELDTRITYALDPVPKHGACSGGLGDAPGDREAHGSGLGLPVARLRVTMEATATGRTPINLVQHTHWNLCGLRAVNNGSDVSSHRLKVHSAYYTPVDTHLIPTGAVEPVQGTPLDLRAGPCLGESLPQISGGLDHNYVLHTEERDRTPLATDPGGMIPGGIRLAAELCDSKSGRWLRLSTNAPGLQVYSGNFLDGVPGKRGVHHKARQSICLESQTYPNSTKQPLFPSPWLSPGQTYRHVMLYEFGCVASG